MDKGIISFSGFGSSFISSTIFRIGLQVFLAMLEQGILHDSLVIFLFFIGGPSRSV